MSATTRGYNWRPRHRSCSRSSVSNLASKAEKGWGGSLLGPAVGSVIGPIKPNAFFKARSIRVQFGAKSFGPPAGPIHKTEVGSFNGGPIAPSSSKL